jgi:hypothetical protein
MVLKLYFKAKATASDYQLYETNGTSAGTMAIAPVGANHTDPLGSSSNFITALEANNALYLSAWYDADSAQLWRLGNPVTAIENNAISSSFSVFPNPTTQYLNISLEQAEKGIISIEDITGKTVYTVSIEEGETTKTIAVENLNAGMYFIHYHNNNNTVTRKFLKE